MNEAESLPTSVMVASFFKRLEIIESIIRIVISEARLSALFIFRGQPQVKVLMDYTRSVSRILIDDQGETGHIHVTIDAEIMHNILMGAMKPGAAVGQREMLLRGSAYNLAKFIPLFDLAPLLYGEHLADIGYDGFARSIGKAPLKEAVMSGRMIKEPPLYDPHLSLFERAIFGFTNLIAYLLGYVVGFMRYRLFEKMSLFSALEAMSQGISKAKPRRDPTGDSTHG
jgi:hypothetical protein